MFTPKRAWHASIAPSGPMEPAGMLVLITQIPSGAASAAILAPLRRNVIDSMPKVMSNCFSTFPLLPLGPIALQKSRPRSHHHVRVTPRGCGRIAGGALSPVIGDAVPARHFD